MLKMNLIGLYGSVIQCKSMIEGELSIRMNVFVPYTCKQSPLLLSS